MPKREAASAAAVAPDLEAKSLPSRPRGITTYELILATAGELLAEVGFERLTTNLVCERAGLTPPALYRYFPNKYALLSELARRLMEAQDREVFEWLEEGGRSGETFEAALAGNRALHKRLISATRSHPGGAWILRAIRAIPLLQNVRALSRDKVLGEMLDLYRARYPHMDDERLRTAMRLSEQMTYAAIEMIIEDPDLDEDLLAEETAWMVTQYHESLSRRRKS
jgi:AcrR family transcriptional regulator